MKRQLIAGVLILIVGVILFIAGNNASHSIADQVNNTFYGRFTQATTWYILGGAVTGLFGLYLLLSGLFSRRT